MTNVINAINTYGYAVVLFVFTTLAAAAGVWLKKKADSKFNSNRTKEIVRICVQATEQMYKSLHGREKFEKCAEAVVQILAAKGVTITNTEMQMLIEATLSEFNGAFISYGIELTATEEGCNE